MEKIKQKEVTKKIFYVECPECKEEIRGTSASQVNWNLEVHLKSKHNK